MADKPRKLKPQQQRTGKLSAAQLDVLFGPAKAKGAPAKQPPKPALHPQPASKATKPDNKPAQPNKPHVSRETKRETASQPEALNLSKQMADIAARSHKLLHDFKERHQPSSPAPIPPSSVINAFIDFNTKLMSNPARLWEAQAALWHKYINLLQQSSRKFMGETAEPVAQPAPGDKRFKDPAWQENPVFDYIKQSYLLTSQWLQQQVKETDNLSEDERRKVDFYTRQFVDALSPTNFALTNPQVLRETLDSKGENLLRGLRNLLEDMEHGRIRMTDEKAFEVGKNLAISPGAVVYRNELMELIQYSPSTPTVAKRPLIIAPPWINKYYILDLKPENSFIKWAVAQGLTVFCISWVNPDDTLAKMSFADYMHKGILTSIEQVQKITGEPEVNYIGYCLGGTLLSSTLAWLTARKHKLLKAITSATYFTTMVDFKEAGELSVFIDEEQLKQLEEGMKQRGYLDASQMATSFNMLRANDLIWSFVVNNYLMGKQPFPFDLLYWNSDSTRMPAAMHSFYLREMYQHNRLVKKGGIKLDGTPLDLRSISTPSMIISAREDHIAPWASTYAATQLYKGPVEFVLAGSGHIAGVVNPPAANKYCHWTNSHNPATPQAWLEGAKETPGSWWPHWRNWLKKFDGGEVPARSIKAPLEAAPGSYVKVRAV